MQILHFNYFRIWTSDTLGNVVFNVFGWPIWNFDQICTSDTWEHYFWSPPFKKYSTCCAYNFDPSSICVFVYLRICSWVTCICATFTEVVFVYMQVRHSGTLFLRSLYHNLSKNITCYISVTLTKTVFVFFAHQILGNIIFEILVPSPFQKYSTCRVYVQLWPKLYLCIYAFVYLYLGNK